MKTLKIITITSFVALTTSIISCKKQNVETSYDCTGTSPTYTSDVKSLIDKNCATSGCHNSASKADGKDYSTYSNVKSASSSNSFLGSMQHLNKYTPMPKGASKLSDAQLKTISCWIQNGTPQ